MEARDDGRVGVGDAVPIRLGAPRRRDPLRVEKVFGSPGNTVERPSIFPPGDLRVGSPRLVQSQLARQGDDALQLRVEAFDPLEVDPREPLRSQRARLDPTREDRDRREGDVLVASRQRVRPGRAPHEPVGRGSGGDSRDHRIPAGRRGDRVFQDDLPRAGAALHRLGHRLPPVARGLRALRRRHLHAHELFGLRERRDSDLGPHRRRRPERRRRSRCRSRLRSRDGRPGIRGRAAGSRDADHSRGRPRKELPAGFRHGVSPWAQS